MIVYNQQQAKRRRSARRSCKRLYSLGSLGIFKRRRRWHMTTHKYHKPKRKRKPSARSVPKAHGSMHGSMPKRMKRKMRQMSTMLGH